MTLRVAYIVSRFPHLPETFILREISELEKQGIKVELFPLVIQRQEVFHKESKTWLDRARNARFFSLECISANFRRFARSPLLYLTIFFRVFRFNLPSIKFWLRAMYIFPLAVWMAEVIETLDISHIHAHYATHPALAAYIISSLTRIPYSVTVHAHDIYVNRTMLPQKARKAVFIRAISRFNLEFLRCQLGDWAADKTYVIHCGIRPQDFHTAPRKDTGKLKIITVGSLQPYKGHEYLIRACEILRKRRINFECLIVGGGERRAELCTLIDQLGLADCVVLLGPLPEERVAELLAKSDCFMLPSVITPSGKMEGIPVVLMEALASRLPVIATAISGIPELIRDEVSGLLVPQKDPLALAEKAVWISQHPREAGKMAEAGRKIVRKEFNLEKNVAELAELFNQNYQN